MDLLLPQSSRGKMPIIMKSESECENDEIGVVFRYKDNKEGRMNSVFYLILQVRQISDNPSRVPVIVQSMVNNIFKSEDEEEVAGHIDLAERIQVTTDLLSKKSQEIK